MAYTHDETIPSATRVAFPTGATDITDFKAGVRDILNTALSNNALPTPPATLANYNSQIPTPGPGVVPAPLRWRGDMLDLRGCTYRLHGPVTDAALRTTVLTGNGVAIPNLQLVITPVSAQSVIQFFVGLLYRATCSSSIAANSSMRGTIRVRNTTAAAFLAPAAQAPVLPGTGGDSWAWLTLCCETTGISGANTFDVHEAVISAANSMTLNVRGDLEASHFYAIEYV